VVIQTSSTTTSPWIPPSASTPPSPSSRASWACSMAW
jgi:hypothetical protein